MFWWTFLIVILGAVVATLLVPNRLANFLAEDGSVEQSALSTPRTAPAMLSVDR